MPTIQPSADHSRPRLRGDMYLRAEQRKREELAADDREPERVTASTPVASVTEVLTQAPGGTTTTVVPARPALELIDAVTIELPSVPRPVLPIRRRRQTLMPAATLGAVAIVAILGVVLTLSPGDPSEEPTTATVPTAAGPASAASSKTPTVEPVPVATTTAPAPVPTPSTREITRTARTPAVTGATVSTARALDGQIRVTSTPPGARVTVDGIGWGQTPLTVGHLPFGTKTVRLTRDGYASREAIVRVSAGTPTQSVNVSLRRR